MPERTRSTTVLTSPPNPLSFARRGGEGGEVVASPKVIILLPSFSPPLEGGVGGGGGAFATGLIDKKSWAMILMSPPKEAR